jgi:hypothetical protein
MKTGSRELRHLINIYGLNQEELKKVRNSVSTDSSLDKVQLRGLDELKIRQFQRLRMALMHFKEPLLSFGIGRHLMPR